MTKRIKWGVIVGVLLVVLVLSQWVLVSLVYARKLSPTLTLSIANLYHLKAGTVKTNNGQLNVYLADYLENKSLLDKYIAKNSNQDKNSEQFDAGFGDLKPAEIDKLVWDKLVKEAWLAKMAKAKKIVVTETEIKEHLDNIGGVDYVKDITAKEYNLPFDRYESLIIKPYILEAKVYQSLLENYKDEASAQKAQAAYTALESGRDFVDVGKEFSDDQTYLENSLWLTEDELVDVYAPIKDLKVGEFTKITKVPIGYVIWSLKSISTESDKTAREINEIFISTKSLDNFLQDYLKDAKVKRLYNNA